MTVLFAEAGADALSAQVDLASPAVNESLVQIRRRVAGEFSRKTSSRLRSRTSEVALGGPDPRTGPGCLSFRWDTK
jgi:hypothetical protein